MGELFFCAWGPTRGNWVDGGPAGAGARGRFGVCLTAYIGVELPPSLPFIHPSEPVGLGAAASFLVTASSSIQQFAAALSVVWLAISQFDVLVTSSIDQLDACEHMLLYRTNATWMDARR